MRDFIFFVLAGIAALMAVGCVSTKSILRSAVYLMGVLTASAGLYIVLDAEFLAGVQVLVYVGGVVVLLVFAVMMTKTETVLRDIQVAKRRWVGLLTALAFFVLNVFVVSRSLPGPTVEDGVAMKNDVAQFGNAFLDLGGQGYLFPFELISVLLLAVLVGGIYLAHRPKPGEVKA